MSVSAAAQPATTMESGEARRARINRIRRRREARTGWMFLAPFALLFIVSFLVPILVSIKESVFRTAPSGGGLYGGGELVTPDGHWIVLDPARFRVALRQLLLRQRHHAALRVKHDAA